MRLYHGSNVEIKQPDLSRSKPFKDFGKGFYLSPVYDQAWARAKQITDMFQIGVPFVSVFDWDEAQAREAGIRIKEFEDYSSEWAEFVLMNRDRQGLHPAHDYDVVIGPIADDGVTYQLRRYREGDISMYRLLEELKYAGGLTIQYFFGTERALSFLVKV